MARRVMATSLCCERLEERVVLTSLPVGLDEVLVTTNANLAAPTAMQFSPTDELWVLEQAGAVKFIRADGTSHTALNLTVDSRGERGLLGIAFDPQYDGSGPNVDYVYLYYTTPRTSPTDPPNNRLSRFVVVGAGTDTPTLTSETILRNLPPEDEDNDPTTDGDTNHNGGAIHFGLDGKLYVGVGDHNYDTTPQSAHVSQILSTPFGKMLRLSPDGTNPADNPFYAGDAHDWQGAIWALGLRNPFNFAFQPETGTMFINDVGELSWEEINLGEAGANYGWAGSTQPLWEGFESPQPPWANYRDPIMAYDHSNSPPSSAGCAITGGVFLPAHSPLGSAFAGKYLFADFCGNFIRVFDPANPGSDAMPDTSSDFASDLTGRMPVDLKVDAAGNLYYLARNPGAIYRITIDVDADTVGLFAPDSNQFFLRNALAAGAADEQFVFGAAQQNWVPLSGDFNGDGRDTIALYAPASGTFFLSNTNAAGAADVPVQFGPAGQGWVPLVGDWNSNSQDTVGLYDPQTSFFYRSNSNSPGPADLVFQYGGAGLGWLPLSGDWDGSGTDSIGLYNPTDSTFFLRNQNSAGAATFVYQFGPAGSGWLPIVGDWYAQGADRVGLYDPVLGSFFIRQEHASGAADAQFAFGPAGQGWLPLAGNWDAAVEQALGLLSAPTNTGSKMPADFPVGPPAPHLDALRKEFISANFYSTDAAIEGLALALAFELSDPALFITPVSWRLWVA